MLLILPSTGEVQYSQSYTEKRWRDRGRDGAREGEREKKKQREERNPIGLQGKCRTTLGGLWPVGKKTSF